MYAPILPPDMDFTCKNSEGSQKSNREVICSTIFLCSKGKGEA